MKLLTNSRALLLVAVCLLIFSSTTTSGQQNERQTSPVQNDDVIRIKSELVQTGVMVFDKQGRFVDGLRREQFELSVGGKPQPITFFEQVKSGSANEEAQLAVARGTATTPATEKAPIVNLDRGRSIVFFADDLHLSLDSIVRTRRMLERFIENEMGQNDQVAIASTSGQVGFLQQFTDNKAVLRAAVARLVHRPYDVSDMSNDPTPMTEYMALTIERKDDPGVLTFYVNECLKRAPQRYPRSSCEVEVINRARMILLQAASVISNTYASLESLMRSSEQMPGRKLAFFISDGFLLDTGPRNSDPRDRLGRITDAAQRAGVVIYTIDARGLVSGLLDATNNVPLDPNGRLESASLREIPASQDALNALAADTGGRALRNQSVFDPWINKVLEETSNYYLLAWRPDTEEQTSNKFQNIKVHVIGHPEFTVRLPRGFLNARSETSVSRKPNSKTEAKSPPEILRDALGEPHPKREVPTSLSLIYLDTPANGAVITASVQVSNEAPGFGVEVGNQGAAIDVAGVILNDKGKPVGSFQTRLNVDALRSAVASSQLSNTIYNYRLPLDPGLFQVRVATRDSKSGHVGGATQWIEIPGLTSRRLTLSSLIVGLQDVEAKAPRTDAVTEHQVQFSVDHYFPRHSRMRFMTFIYNVSRDTMGNPSSEIRAEAGLMRNGQTILKVPSRAITTGKQDSARIPFASEITLDSIPPGRYILEVTVTDRTTNTSASQRTGVTIW